MCDAHRQYENLTDAVNVPAIFRPITALGFLLPTDVINACYWTFLQTLGDGKQYYPRQSE